MPPLLYTALRFAWGFLWMGAGALAGAGLAALGAGTPWGRGMATAPLAGGLGGFCCASLLWGRYAWVRCPSCRSRMVKVQLGGRNAAYKCPMCGRMDNAF